MESLKTHIREIPDFPKEGILFYDITTLLRNGDAYRRLVDLLADRYRDQAVDAVVGVEARGFIFASAVAYRLGAGFIPVRKPGKLPYRTVSKTYELEYGSDTVEMHEDAVANGDRILIVDDLIATGGTARATADLVAECGGQVVELAFAIELEFLNGRDALAGYDVFSVLKY